MYKREIISQISWFFVEELLLNQENVFCTSCTYIDFFFCTWQMERFNSFDGEMDELSKPDLFAYEVIFKKKPDCSIYGSYEYMYYLD